MSRVVAILVSRTWRQGDFEVFDFEVEGLHNFYVRGPGGDAAGVLVHNSTGGDDMVRVFTTTDGPVDLGRAQGTFVTQTDLTDPANLASHRQQFVPDTGTRTGNLGFPDTVTEIEVPRSSLMPDATDARAAARYPEMGHIPANAPGASVKSTHKVKASLEEGLSVDPD